MKDVKEFVKSNIFELIILAVFVAHPFILKIVSAQNFIVFCLLMIVYFLYKLSFKKSRKPLKQAQLDKSYFFSKKVMTSYKKRGINYIEAELEYLKKNEKAKIKGMNRENAIIVYQNVINEIKNKQLSLI